MNVLTDSVSKYLYAVPFVVFGLFHFMNGSAMAGLVPIPGGVFWVYLTGAAHLAAAASIIIGKKTRLAGLLLGVMLLIFALSIHLPEVISSAGENVNAMTNFLKDTALAGGAWVIAGRFGEGEAQSSSADAGSGDASEQSAGSWDRV